MQYLCIHLQNNVEIDVSGYNAVEAKNYLSGKGYEIQTKQEKLEITITADAVTSTDDSFAMNNINAGDAFKLVYREKVEKENATVENAIFRIMFTLLVR